MSAKNNKRRHYHVCANPFEKPKHAGSIKGRTLLKPISKEFFQKVKLLFPRITAEDRLCLLCAQEAYKLIHKPVVNTVELEASAPPMDIDNIADEHAAGSSRIETEFLSDSRQDSPVRSNVFQATEQGFDQNLQDFQGVRALTGPSLYPQLIPEGGDPLAGPSRLFPDLSTLTEYTTPTSNRSKRVARNEKINFGRNLENEFDGYSSLESTPSQGEKKDSSTELSDLDVEMSKLGEKLTKFGVSPLALKSRKRDSDRMIKKKVKTLTDSIISKYNAIRWKRKTKKSKKESSTDLLDKAKKKCDCKCCLRLKSELIKRFRVAKTKTEKYLILTSLPMCISVEQTRKLFGCTAYMARKAVKIRKVQGHFVAPQCKIAKKFPEDLKLLVTNFYLDQKNSQIMPSYRDTIRLPTSENPKNRVRKQNMMMNLMEAYEEFLKCKEFTEYKSKHVGAKIGKSMFALLKPKQCRWPGKKGFTDTCLCIYHQNFKLLMKSCNTTLKTRDIINKIICKDQTDNCWFGLCSACPKFTFFDDLFNELDDDIEFYQWVKENNKTTIKLHQEDKDSFYKAVKAQIPKLLIHHFIYVKQFEFIDQLKGTTIKNENSAIIYVDFAQNYAFVIKDAVQGAHWTNNQATVHPFVILWYEDSADEKISMQTFVVISDVLEHSASSFHIFRKVVMERMKKLSNKLSRIEKIYYISDGAGSQYKCIKNFTNLAFHNQDFGIKAECHFTATSHGKSLCDAYSGTCKQSTRLESLKPGRYIASAQQMFQHCVKALSSDKLEFLYVTNIYFQEQQNILKLEERYSKTKTIVGTRAYHSFVPLSTTEMQVRRFSSDLKFHRVYLEGVKTVTYQVGQYVFVQLLSKPHIAMIAEIKEDGGDIKVQLMKSSQKTNYQQWFDEEKYFWISNEQILQKCSPPTTTTGRAYTLSTSDFKLFQKIKIL